METHFTRGRVRTRGPVVQGYHLNHAVVNDRRRAARSGADDAICPPQFLRRKTGDAKP